MILHPICPGCGHRDAVNVSAIGQTHACSNCGCRYEVGIIEVSPSDFSEGNVGVTCPYCGHVNSAPPQAADHDVACAVCDGTFHLRLVEDSLEDIKHEFNKGIFRIKILLILAIVGYIIYWLIPREDDIKMFSEFPHFEHSRYCQDQKIYAYDKDWHPLIICGIQDGGLFGIDGVHVRTADFDDDLFIKMPVPSSWAIGDILPSMLIKANGRYTNGYRAFEIVCYKYDGHRTRLSFLTIKNLIKHIPSPPPPE